MSRSVLSHAHNRQHRKTQGNIHIGERRGDVIQGLKTTRHTAQGAPKNDNAENDAQMEPRILTAKFLTNQTPLRPPPSPSLTDWVPVIGSPGAHFA